MQISPNFELEEFTTSDTAKSKKIDNTPSKEIVSNLNLLCTNVLESLRELVKKPMFISSGYRCLALNTAIGGSKTSQHMEGKAADIKVKGLTTEELFQAIIKSNIKFDQVIQEFDKWVHISWNGVSNRNEKLRATKKDGKTIYTKIY